MKGTAKKVTIYWKADKYPTEYLSSDTRIVVEYSNFNTLYLTVNKDLSVIERVDIHQVDYEDWQEEKYHNDPGQTLEAVIGRSRSY